MTPEELKQEYREREESIADRLEDFEALRTASDYRWFMELVFVILTSQTSAKKSWEAVEELDSLNLLMEGTKDEISGILRDHGIQYEEKKADYIVGNRELLSQPTLSNPTKELKLKEKVDPDNLEVSRDWLADNLKGVGMKAASHFLRNVGYGNGFAIVSGHIVKKLVKLDVIESTDPPTSREEYLRVEEKARELSRETGIGIKELDLLLWSLETGEVFK